MSKIENIQRRFILTIFLIGSSTWGKDVKTKSDSLKYLEKKKIRKNTKLQYELVTCMNLSILVQNFEISNLIDQNVQFWNLYVVTLQH